jgi:hypothetical protein
MGKRDPDKAWGQGPISGGASCWRLEPPVLAALAVAAASRLQGRKAKCRRSQRGSLDILNRTGFVFTSKAQG